MQRGSRRQYLFPKTNVEFCFDLSKDIWHQYTSLFEIFRSDQMFFVSLRTKILVHTKIPPFKTQGSSDYVFNLSGLILVLTWKLAPLIMESCSPGQSVRNWLTRHWTDLVRCPTINMLMLSMFNDESVYTDFKNVNSSI